MSATLVKKPEPGRAIGRTLKVLVPLIQEELESANSAGLEHYRRAGIMLIEAREQVAAFKWGRWLSANFELSRTSAFRYIKLAQMAEDPEDVSRKDTNLHRALGYKDPNAARSEWRRLADKARRAAKEGFKQERQDQHAETRLSRELLLETFDLGFRAMAMRLHPDKRGGSKEAMARLNRLRGEVKSIVSMRRFW